MSPQPGRIVEVIDCDLESPRPLEIRETAAFAAIGSRVRRALHSGTSHG
jgi:NitT/TauT family transport system ATP-binding protein